MTLLLFPPTGSVRFIHSDAAAAVARAVGPLTIRRASHVEPTADGRWAADMTPVGGPAIIGPFDTRQEALDNEVDWLLMNDIPVPTERRV